MRRPRAPVIDEARGKMHAGTLGAEARKGYGAQKCLVHRVGLDRGKTGIQRDSRWPSACDGIRRTEELNMSIVAWIILGLVSGFIASKIVNHTGSGVLLDVVIGVVGAIVGGFLFNLIGSTGIDGLNIWSMFVAVIGAVVLLGVKHLLVGNRHAHA